MADKDSSIVIKKIKKGGHGHHGGAWKVAYADFVTAMMAFFLLLWLLSATPVENLAGLADYFSPTQGLQDNLGIGFSGGLANSPEGVSVGDWASQGLVFGSPPSGPIIKFPDKDNNINEDNDPNDFGKLEEDINQMIEKSEALKPFKDSILIEQTPEGLRIHIVDRKDRPMFAEGSAEFMPHTEQILEKISEIIRYLPNYIQVSGHTRSKLQPTQERIQNEWYLSAMRANAARVFLSTEGEIPDEKIARLLAVADHDPLSPENPFGIQNERVTITLLKKGVLAYHKQSAPDEILRGNGQGLGDYIEEQKRRDKQRQKLNNWLQESQAPTAAGSNTEIVQPTQAIETQQNQPATNTTTKPVE